MSIGIQPSGSKDILGNIMTGIKALVFAFGYGALGYFIDKRLFIISGNVTLLANANGTIDLTMPTETDGVICDIHAVQTGTFNCRIQRTDDNQYITDAAIPNTLLFGNNANPGLTAVKPFAIKAGAKIRFEVTDTSGAGNTINVAVTWRAK